MESTRRVDCYFARFLTGMAFLRRGVAFRVLRFASGVAGIPRAGSTSSSTALTARGLPNLMRKCRVTRDSSSGMGSDCAGLSTTSLLTVPLTAARSRTR